MSKFNVFCDLDRSLLTLDKRITKETKDFVDLYYKNNGNKFILCTGRPFQACINFYNILELNTPLICDNGSSIYFLNGDKVFFEIDTSIILQFVKETKDLDKYTYISTGHSVYYTHHDELVPAWIRHNENNDVTFIDGELEDIIKVPILIGNFWVKKECIDKFISILDKYKEYIRYINWGLIDEEVYALEIMSSHANKGDAIKYICNALNLDFNSTISFGDELNDIPMFYNTNYSVAMINSREEVKLNSKYVTNDDFDHNGVVNFLLENHLY